MHLLYFCVSLLPQVYKVANIVIPRSAYIECEKNVLRYYVHKYIRKNPSSSSFWIKMGKKNVHFGLVRWLSLDCYIFSVQWSEWSKEKQIFRPTQFILFYYYFYVFFFSSKTHFILNAKSECISNQNFLLLLSVIVRDMFSL